MKIIRTAKVWGVHNRVYKTPTGKKYWRFRRNQGRGAVGWQQAYMDKRTLSIRKYSPRGKFCIWVEPCTEFARNGGLICFRPQPFRLPTDGELSQKLLEAKRIRERLKARREKYRLKASGKKV